MQFSLVALVAAFAATASAAEEQHVVATTPALAERDAPTPVDKQTQGSSTPIGEEKRLGDSWRDRDGWRDRDDFRYSSGGSRDCYNRGFDDECRRYWRNAATRPTDVAFTAVAAAVMAAAMLLLKAD